jgi:ribonuclease HI
LSSISIYTDGSSRGNPGPGGYGIVLQSGKYYKELSQGYRKTTNNRMELMGVIVALQSLRLPNCEVTIYSDSKYVIDSITKGWIWSWIKKGFVGKKNEDLWRQYIVLHQQFKIQYVWVKGHASNEGNNRCDLLATTAALVENLLIDTVYEALGEKEKEPNLFLKKKG